MALHAILNSVQEIYIGLLGRSADNAGLQYWANQISTRVITIEQVRANIVNEQPEYAANLGSLTSRAVLVANLYGNLFNREPDEIGLEYWVNGGGKSVNADQLVLALVNGASAIDRLALDNRVVVANYFTNEAQFNIADARTAILDVNASISSVQLAIDKISNDTVQLTSAADLLIANIFNSIPRFTPGGNDFVNTLQDEDILTGTGINPTLNVTLGTTNDNAEGFINPILNGIQTINVSVTGGDIDGLGLEGASGTKEINITRISQNQENFEIDNIAETVNKLSVSNATREANVQFNFRNDANVSLENTLDITLTNVRLGGSSFEGLRIGRNGSFDDQHDTVNLNTLGPVVEVVKFDLFGDENSQTSQTLNLNAGAVSNVFENMVINRVTNMNIVANGDLSIEDFDDANELVSLSITANKDVIIESQSNIASLSTVTITGSSDVEISTFGLGDTGAGVTIDSTGLAATGGFTSNINSISAFSNTVINTGAGNDTLTTGGSNIAGLINVGGGNNAINTQGNFEGTSSVSASNGNNSIVGSVMEAQGDNIALQTSTNELDSASSISLGNGNNNVSVTRMESAASWNDWNPLDENVDDTYVLLGSTITAGNGTNTINVSSMEENAKISLGNGQNTVNFSGFDFDGSEVMAADTDGPRERVSLSSPTAAQDLLGAQVNLGNGGNTVNFNDLILQVQPEFGFNSTLVGEGALLKSGTGNDKLNVNFINDINVVELSTEEFNSPLIQGFEEINLVAQKAGLDEDDLLIENDAYVFLDVKRVDNELDTINLVSLESTTLVNEGLEVNEEADYHVAGNQTEFTLTNLRESVVVNLTAQEATGVDDGVATDDHEADVFMTADMVNAVGDNDTFTLNIKNSGSFDLDLSMDASSFPIIGSDARDDENNYETENVIINLNTNSHTFYFNEFGDEYENDTSLTVNGTSAGKEIVLNNVNSNTITVNGAGNVTLEMIDTIGGVEINSADNAKLLKVTTGSGNDEVHVNAFSLDVDGSFVNLGTGLNTVGVKDLIALGEDSDIESTHADALESFADLDIRGSVNRVELLDNFDEVYRSVDIDLSRFDGTVSELFIGDFDDDNNDIADDQIVDLTITGMSENVLIQSRNDLKLAVGDDFEDSVEAGRLSVVGAKNITIEAGVNYLSDANDENGVVSKDRSADGFGTFSDVRAGNWVAGEFITTGGFVSSGEVNFNLGTANAVLDSLNVASEDETTVNISENDDTVDFNIGQINVYSYDEDAELYLENNVGVTVTIDSVNLITSSTDGDDAQLFLHNNTDSNFTFGAVTMVARDDAEFHFDENDDGEIVNSSLNITTLDMTSLNDDVEIEINALTDSTVDIGSINIEAGEDVDIFLGGEDDLFDDESNTEVTINIGDIDIIAGRKIQFDINHNYDSTVDIGNITGITSYLGEDFGPLNLSGEDSVDFEILGNIDSNITIASADFESGEDVSFDIQDNDLQSNVINGDMLITFEGPVSLRSTNGGRVDINMYDNDDNSVERDFVINFKDDLTMQSINGSVDLDISNNDDATILFNGEVNLSLTADITNVNYNNVESDLYLDILENDDSTIRFFDNVNLTTSGGGEDSSDGIYFNISDNDFANIRFDKKVTLSSEQSDVEIGISYNDDSSLSIFGGLEIEAKDLIEITISDNDNATIFIESITASNTDSQSIELYIDDNDDTQITIGNVDMDSLGAAVVIEIEDNDDSVISLAAVRSYDDEDDEVITYGTLDAIAANNVELMVLANDDSEIFIGDVNFISTSENVDIRIDDDLSSPEVQDVNVGNITAYAFANIDLYALAKENIDGNLVQNTSELDIKDIYLRAGATQNSLTWVDSNITGYVELDMRNVGTTETIYLQTNTVIDDILYSFINASVVHTPDLHTITMVGGSSLSSLYVYGNQGNDDGVFTIDMTDLKDSVFVRTVTNDSDDDRDFIDEISYGDETIANFAPNTVVQVNIGSADTQYNVEEVEESYLFAGSDSGFVSTGHERDLTPVRLVKTFDLDSDGIGNGDFGTYTFSVEIKRDVSNPNLIESYVGSVDIFDNDGGVDTTIQYDWNLPALPDGYSFSTSGSVITLTGPTSGEGSATVTTAVRVFGDGDGTNDFDTDGTDGTMISDGLGLTEREIFTFTGDEIGDVVIGGFNPGSWNSVSPINSQITDRLDFSEFIGVNSLDDMTFDIDDTGPFSNVVIDFVNDDLGSIILVGVGEYANAIDLVQDSIMFS